MVKRYLLTFSNLGGCGSGAELELKVSGSIPLDCMLKSPTEAQTFIQMCV